MDGMFHLLSWIRRELPFTSSSGATPTPITRPGVAATSTTKASHTSIYPKGGFNNSQFKLQTNVRHFGAQKGSRTDTLHSQL